MKPKKFKYIKIVFIFLTIIILYYLILLNQSNDNNSLIVYCTHDSVYSEKILKIFQERTGINVIPRFDTEATKSLSLIELIKSERDNPRCDLFWNNELLGTKELKDEDLLLPYKGTGYKRIPTQYKDIDGYWCGFAARLRVYIVNKKFLSEIEKADGGIGQFIENNLKHFAIAKPLYGTTLTHYTLLWSQMGEIALKSQHEKWINSGVKFLNGNAAVKDVVAVGGCKVGWTDTDDFYSAIDHNQNIIMIPIKLKNKETILIPNSVAIIKGTTKRENAEKLADFLLSEECELLLANSPSRQIPLGDVEENKLPDDVKLLRKLSRKSVSYLDLNDSRQKCIEWLKTSTE